MGTTNTTHRSLALLLVVYLLINTVSVDSKRLFGGGSSRKSSGSSGSRTSHGSSGSRSHGISHTSQSHSSNHDLTRLSYAPSYSQPSHKNTFGSSSSVNRGNTFGTNTHHQPSAPVASAPHATVSPIGWNVPKKQGPPPAYNPVNTAGGAKTNLHEPPPTYRQSVHQNTNPSAPTWSNPNTNSRAFTPAQTYRPSNRVNSTGGFGGFGGTSSNNFNNKPFTATNAGHGVQSSYPRQQVPAGATYYPSNSHLPAGASYHPSGSIPAGATYHPSGNVPHGANYYPSSSHLPAGASYHPAGQVPQGAHYYPSGGIPAGASYHPAGQIPAGAHYYPAGAVPAAAHYPSAPAGATYLPAGAALPAGAVMYAQPPKSSSGLGFGSGLAAGALGGALLGHALTPQRTVYGSGYSGMGGGMVSGGAQPQGGQDKVIIINNGPPGSVSTTNAADGVTVINAGQQQPQQQPGPQYQQPYQPQAGAPLAPVAPPPAVQQSPELQSPAAQTPVAASVTAQPNTAASPPVPATGTATQEQPPAGGIICVPVRVPQPDPKDANKTIEVEQIACYPAPPPEAAAADTTVAAPAASTTANAPITTSPATTATSPPQTPSTAKDGVALAPLQSTITPYFSSEGGVPLAPLNPTAGQPDIWRMPGEPAAQYHSSSQVMLAPDSNVHVAALSSASKYFDNFAFTSLLTLLLAYCLH